LVRAGRERFFQIVLVATFLPLCWFGMMAVHELGHITAAVATGGTVTQVVLHPLTISRTDVQPNPQPLIVVWAGPIAGVTAPLILWAVCHGWRIPGAYLSRFFAGACCICNGAYIGAGSLHGIGDCGAMLHHGSPMWTLWLFAIVTLPTGIVLWNGQGEHFGLGKACGRVDKWAAVASAVLLLLYLLIAPQI